METEFERMMNEVSKTKQEISDKTKSLPVQARVALVNDNIRLEKKWTKNSFYIPKEEIIKATPFGTTTAFKTHDKEMYVRNGLTGEIRSYNPKVKGKKARKEEKRRRRMK